MNPPGTIPPRLPPWLRTRLADVLGPLDEAAWSELELAARIVDLPAGTALFEAGEPAEDWYVVLSGRLSIISPASADGEAQRLADVGAGEILGELAVLTGRTRSASVRALRDSSLLLVSSQLLHTQLLSKPERAAVMLRHLALRMAERTIAPRGRRVTGLCIAVLPADTRVNLAAFTRDLAAHLSAWGRCAHCGAEDLISRAELHGVHTADHRASAMWVDAELDARAATVDHLLLRADAADTPWTRQVLQRADRVLVVAHAQEDADPPAHEQAWLSQRQRKDTTARVPATLALLQPADRPQPRDTARWLMPRPGFAHLHLAAGREADMARLARHLAGRSVVLALSGGGARCFAHLGVVQALQELGIPIDGVAGTSGGAMSGALVAQRLSAPALHEAARRFHEARPFGRGTLPLYALRSDAPFDAALRQAMGELQLEDLWLPLVVVSANLTRAQPHRHRQGSVFDAVRASSSLPGILPPRLLRGELLVDGGLVDNLPVAAAGEEIGGRVLAVDVAEDTVPRFDADQYPSPWQRLLGQHPDRRRTRPPGLLAILMHSLLLGSLAQTRRQREAAELCLRPPLQGFGMMDTGHWAEIIACGHRHALEVMTARASDWR